MAMTREQALLWLNDRSGHMAQLTVMTGPDSAFPASAASAVLSVAGRLIHWRRAVHVEDWAEVDRSGDHGGTYKVGSGVLYVPVDARARASTDDEGRVEVLYVPLDANTGVYVLIADEEHPIFGGGA